MCPSILKVVLEFSSFCSVISSGLFDLTVCAQYASLLIVAGMLSSVFSRGLII